MFYVDTKNQTTKTTTKYGMIAFLINFSKLINCLYRCFKVRHLATVTDNISANNPESTKQEKADKVEQTAVEKQLLEQKETFETEIKELKVS